MNHDLSAKYWNDRYLENNFSWDIGAISTPLKTYFDQLQNKNLSVLIPGAGNAYEAEYLVNADFTQVYVCDIAEAPLKNLKQRCPVFQDDHLLLIDFFSLDSQFDLIIEQTFFCALDPLLRKQYFEKMNALLKPSGKLVGLLFNDVLNADRPPFGGNKEEYEQYFSTLFDVHVYETCYNSIKPRAGRELFINLQKIHNVSI